MAKKNGLMSSEVGDSPKKSSGFFALFRPEPDAFKPTKDSIREAGDLLHSAEDHNDTICGIGAFTPQWLQRLARKEVYLLVYCLVGLMQGMFFTYTVSVISTLEKRFKLTSKQTGTILCGNDLSQIVLAILLGYFGNYGHRPRWVGIGVLCAAISCFIASVPHFIYGPGQDAIDIVESLSVSTDLLLNLTDLVSKKKKVELCYTELDDCGEGSYWSVHQSYLGPIILFFTSQFFVGIAISLFYSIGVTYMDDNVSKKTYPLYYSMTLLLRILGPVMGYLVGGKCLSTWIDPAHNPNLTRRDPRWLGAWWMGYVFIGTGLACVGGLLFLFPRHLPATLKRQAKRVVRQASRDQSEGGKGRGIEYFASLARTKKVEADRPNMRNLWMALKRLFTNKIWVGNLFNTVLAVLAFSGYWNFKPKYLENQFRKSATEANYYTGMASMTSVVLGTGIGGFILRYVRPRPRYVAGYNIFVTLFLSAGFLVLMFIGCPKLKVIGPVEGSEIPDCSTDCGCSERYSPVCSEDQSTVFYSPCYAGCTVVNASASPIVYSGCSCIPGNNITTATTTYTTTTTTTTTTISSIYNTTISLLANEEPQKTEDRGGRAKSGYCPEPCDMFFYYLIVQIIIKTVSSTGRVGSSVIHLRSVREEDKGLALGTLTVFISLFGFLPAPIIMGAIIDSSCLVWDHSCGRTGNCWLYDSDKFRNIMHIVPSILVFISVIGDIVVYYYSYQLDLYGDKDDDIVEMEGTQKTSKSVKGGEVEIEEEAKPLNTHKDEDFLT